MKNLVLLGAVVIVLSCSFYGVFSGPTCSDVILELTPCVNFMKGSNPSPSCCTGIKRLDNLVKSKDDRAKACQCAKDALSNFKYDPNRIPLLPKACGVNINLPPLDKNTDCKKW